MTPRERAILKLLDSRGGAAVMWIKAALGSGPVMRPLRELCRTGLVESLGFCYRITYSGREALRRKPRK